MLISTENHHDYEQVPAGLGKGDTTLSSPGCKAEEQDSSQCYFTWHYKLYLEEPKDRSLAGITAVSRKRLWRINYGPTHHTETGKACLVLWPAVPVLHSKLFWPQTDRQFPF